MSRSIDERVVKMEFDNRDFEKNVSTTMSTLDRLKQSLGLLKSGNEIGKLSEGLDIDKVSKFGDAVSNVGDKFSAMEAIALGALMRIGEQIVDLGEKLANELVFDNINQGWDKYAQKTTAMQTVMAATRESWKKSADALGFEGTQMDFVNSQIDKLNWFTDETSYNFSDMVTNIGKFTNNGIALEDAVTSMEGIANWAGISGATISNASQAMYNFSQAMGVGYMSLKDWRSIENANMATMEFKQQVVDAALAQGTLKEVTEQVKNEETGQIETVTKYISTIQGLKQEAKSFDLSGFSSELASKWMTVDVMNAALQRYGKATDLIKDTQDSIVFANGDQYYDTASKLLRDIDAFKEGHLDLQKIADDTGMSIDDLTAKFEALGSEENDLGIRAFKAAQEAKTYQEAIDSVKDAASTAWMNIFEIIFGNYEQAKDLWTYMANELWDVFVGPIDDLRTAMEKWSVLGGRDLLLGMDEEDPGALILVWEHLKETLDLVSEAFSNVMPEDLGQAIYDLTADFKEWASTLEWTEKGAETFKTVLTGAFKIVATVAGTALKVVGGIGKAIGLVADSVGFLVSRFLDNGGLFHIVEIVQNLKGHFDTLGRIISNVFRRELPNKDGIHKVLYDIAEILIKVISNVDTFVARIRKLPIEDIVNLKNTITGVLSVFRIIKEVIFQVASGFASLFKGFNVDKFADGFINLRSGVLGVTGGIGNLITGFADWLQESKAIEKGVSGVVEIVKKLVGGVSDLFSSITGMSIGDAFGKLMDVLKDFGKTLGEIFGKKADTSGISETVDEVDNKFRPVKALFDGVKKVFEALWKLFDKLKPVFSKVGELIGDALGALGDGLTSFINNVDLTKILGLLNGIQNFRIKGSIVDVFKSLSEAIGGHEKTNPIKVITDFISSLKDTLEEFQKSIKISNLIKIAVAIGILTASVAVLADIEPAKIASSLGALTVEFIELVAAMEIISKTMDASNGDNMKKIATTMIEMGVAILIMAKAMKTVADLEWEEIAKGLVALGGLLLELSLSMKLISKDNGDFQVKALSIIAFATAVKMLAGVMKDLAELDWDEIVKGLVGLGGVLLEMSLFMNKTDMSSMGVSTGLGLIAFATGILIIAQAVKQMGEISWQELVQGLGGLAVVLLAMVETINKLPTEGMVGLGAGMILFGAALVIVAKAVQEMGSMNLGELAIGLGGLALALEIIVKDIQDLPEDTLIKAAGMVVMGGAIKIIASAMTDLAQIDLWGMIKALVGLGGVLAELVIALNLMEGTMSGAAAMIVAAGAIAILVPPLKSLGEMSLWEIVKSLLELAGVFTILAVAGGVLGPMLPVLSGLAGVIALLGVATLAAGAGLSLFGTGLTMIAASGIGAIATLKFAIESFLELLPTIVLRLGETIQAILKVVGDSAVSIADCLVKVVSACITAFMGTVPQFVEAVVTFVEELVTTFAQHAPNIVEQVLILLEELLSAFNEHLPKIVALGAETLMNFMIAIQEYIPQLVQTGIDLVLGLVNGLAEGIENNREAVKEAFTNLFNAVIDCVKDLLGIHSPSEVFSDIGVNMIQGAIDGIMSLAETIKEKVSGLMGDVVQKVKDKATEFYEAGVNAAKGLKEGLESMGDKIKEAGEWIADKVSNATKGALKISSPSKVFAEIGKYSDEGLAFGMINNANLLVGAADTVGGTAVDAMQEALSGIGDYLIDDINIDPVITPVIDLSNVEAGADTINGLLADQTLQVGSIGFDAATYGYSAQPSIYDALHGMGNTTNYGATTINVYGAEGQDVRQLADIVEQRINARYARRREAWA